MFSLTTEYAIRALTFLATQAPKKPTLVHQIAQGADIPAQYLSKVMMQLKRQGLLKSIKGPGGGFFFARHPQEITLMEVIRLLEPKLLDSHYCVMGLPDCGDRKPCPLHDHWGSFRTELVALFSGLSLAELAKGLADHRTVLRFAPEEGDEAAQNHVPESVGSEAN
jgi:Rrf2 family protein